MIERIQGTILEKTPTHCVVQVGPVGLEVMVSLNTSQKMGGKGEAVELLTHLHVREDVLQLYGFSDQQEREMFRLLIGVSGVGPRLALTILSGLTVPELVQSIAAGDFKSLTRIPGVGKKTAQRVILELKEKVQVETTEEMPEAVQLTSGQHQVFEEAMLALVTLGYKPAEARKAVQGVFQHTDKELPVEEIVKLALKQLWQ
jgi:Holliday junction DNA helicase RuvA